MARSKVTKGLGRGLNVLIPEKNDTELTNENIKIVEKIVEKKVETIVKITEVEPNRNQPRRNFNEDALLELADSIKNFGIIQPLVVQKKEDYYEIIAGERRWRAAKIAGIKEVPVIIKEYSDEEVMEIALIENIQREDLNPIEEAMAYKRLLKEYNLKQDEVAEKVSKSRTAITNTMRLLNLSEEVQQMVIDEMITSGHARALLGIEDKEMQVSIANKIFDEKLSVRETEKLVKGILNPKPIKEKEIYNDQFAYENMENKIKNIVGSNVLINRKKKDTGKIEIEYYSIEDLERIVELLEKIN